MADNITRTEHVSWFERIVDAIKGVLVGLLLFVVSFPLLFWNEGRAVRRAQDLEEGRGAVVELDRHLKDPTDVYVEGVLVARGEVVIVDDKIGVTLSDFIKSNREWKR